MYHLHQIFPSPTKGNWVIEVIDDLEELEIDINISEIGSLSKNRFSSIVKEHANKKALEYFSIGKMQELPFIPKERN